MITTKNTDPIRDLKSAISEIMQTSDRSFESIYAIATVLQTCLQQGGTIHAGVIDSLLETIRHQSCSAQDLIFSIAGDVGVGEHRKFVLMGQISVTKQPISEASNDQAS